MIKVLQSCIVKLSLHSVNSALIIYRTGNMQSAILLSFVAYSYLPPCGLQSTHSPMPCYISPYVVYNVYGGNSSSDVTGLHSMFSVLLKPRIYEHTEWFTHQMVHAPNGSRTKWFAHQIVHAPNGLHTKWFAHQMVCTPNGLCTKWFLHRMVCAPSGLRHKRTEWFAHQMVRAPNGLRTK